MGVMGVYNEILSILEQITETCKLLCNEVYSSLDYSNSSFEMYADKFTEIQNKIFELQEICKELTLERR